MLTKVKKLVFESQDSIISAAFVIMAMSVAARILGLVRQRILLHFFPPEDMALFFAAFKLPDLIFEVLTFGALSSAFIPVFSKAYSVNKTTAWKTVSSLVNIGLIIFSVTAVLFSIFSYELYLIIAPGFSQEQTVQVANMARVLFAAQGFFLVSYILTGVLESLRRFVVPAIAPIFYNIGIVLGTIAFAQDLGLMAPVVGVVIGAIAHFLVQFPFALRLGFRFSRRIEISSEVKKIGKLAMPRMIELSVLQLSRVVELALASLIATASYTYYNLAYSVQAIPVGLFGLSLAKAALPTLSVQADDLVKFRKTLLNTLYQILFLVIPLAVILIVLRIPIVRLLFGTDIFDWPATVQTGLVLSAFAIGIPFHAIVVLLSRAFFALNNTKTPVAVSLAGTGISIVSGVVMVLVLGLPTWALGLAYAFGVIVQAFVLYLLLSRSLNGGSLFAVKPILKSTLSAAISGVVMFVIIKFFDRWSWIQQISLVGHWEAVRRINFETFVIDTNYTINLLILTSLTGIIGILVYILSSYVFKSQELLQIVKIIKRKRFVLPAEDESVSPSPTDGNQV